MTESEKRMFLLGCACSAKQGGSPSTSPTVTVTPTTTMVEGQVSSNVYFVPESSVTEVTSAQGLRSIAISVARPINTPTTTQGVRSLMVIEQVASFITTECASLGFSVVERSMSGNTEAYDWIRIGHSRFYDKYAVLFLPREVGTDTGAQNVYLYFDAVASGCPTVLTSGYRYVTFTLETADTTPTDFSTYSAYFCIAKSKNGVMLSGEGKVTADARVSGNLNPMQCMSNLCIGITMSSGAPYTDGTVLYTYGNQIFDAYPSVSPATGALTALNSIMGFYSPYVLTHYDIADIYSYKSGLTSTPNYPQFYYYPMVIKSDGHGFVYNISSFNGRQYARWSTRYANWVVDVTGD